MTAIRLNQPPEPEKQPESDFNFVIEIPSDEEILAKFGDLRYQCDQCLTTVKGYMLSTDDEEPTAGWFGLSLEMVGSLSSMDIGKSDPWRKLCDGDLHFCSMACAGQWFTAHAPYTDFTLSIG